MILVDGFTTDAPETRENQAIYPQNPPQAEGLNFPMLCCVAVISMTTGLLIDLAYACYSDKGSGETSLLRKLKDSLKRSEIFVADSYYCTYWLIVDVYDAYARSPSGATIHLDVLVQMALWLKVPLSLLFSGWRKSVWAMPY